MTEIPIESNGSTVPEWLPEVRATLRSKAINLNGRFVMSEDEEARLNIFGGRILSLLEGLRGIGGGEIMPVSREREFSEGMRQGMERCIKGAKRAEKKGVIRLRKNPGETPSDLVSEESLQGLLCEYQDLITQSLEWTNTVNDSTFNKAATLMAFHNRKRIARILSDESIAAILRQAGAEMGVGEVGEVFTRRVRMYFAVNNITDPLEGVRRVGKHLKETLTDEKIGEVLRGAGAEMGAEEIGEVFTKRVRMHFAVGNITDPLEGCLKYARGEVGCGGKFFERR